MNALQVETCMLYMYFKETSLISHASLESSNKESINQSINQGHTVKQLSILTQIGRFRTVTPGRVLWWLWNDAQSLKQQRRGALMFPKVNCRISSSHQT